MSSKIYKEKLLVPLKLTPKILLRITLLLAAVKLFIGSSTELMAYLQLATASLQ